MPDVVFEKDVGVTSIVSVPEIATGDILYQVTFGEYIKATTERLSRLVSGIAMTGRSEISTMWLVLNTRQTPVPYLVGSKWKMSISADGSVKLVEIK